MDLWIDYLTNKTVQITLNDLSYQKYKSLTHNSQFDLQFSTFNQLHNNKEVKKNNFISKSLNSKKSFNFSKQQPTRIPTLISPLSKNLER